MYTKSFVIKIRIPNSATLKNKRSIIKSISQLTQNKFKISIGEIDFLEEHKIGSIGFAIISNEKKHIYQKENAIISYIELNLLGKAEIIEILHDENKI